MGRRGNGEGSIYQLPDGRWRGQATIAGRRVGVYGKTRKEAQAGLRELQGNADKGLLPAAGRVTVAQLAERWLEDVARHSVKPRTRDFYADKMRLYVLPTLGNCRLTSLQPAHLQKLYSDLLDRGLSAQTVHHVHTVLHRALRQAVEWNHVPRNVADVAHAPRVKRTEMRVLTAEQANILQMVAADTRYEALIALAVSSGMRKGELLGLRWQDVDLDEGTVHVRRQLDQNGRVSEPKTAKARRRIGLPASTVAALRAHKRRQAEHRLLWGPEWEDNDLVFCTHQGRPLGASNLSRDFKRLLRRAGLPDIRFHDLRHTNATLLLLQNTPAKVVSERLGHASIQITLDTYSHVLPSMDRDAADRLEALLG